MLFIHRPQDQQAASTMRQRWWPKEFTSTADISLTGVAGKAPHNLNRRLAMTDNSVDSNQATDKCRLTDKITGRKFPLNPEDFAAISAEEICQIVSDVLVHQIELEIQNEQLLRTQQAQTATRAQYYDLYNLAPVGYCTFNELGEIVEANIAATELLNMGRAELIGQPITRYIHFEDQEIFYHHHTQLLETGDGQTCQLRLMRRGQPPFWARLDATVALGENGGLAGQPLSNQCHLIASDNGTDMLQFWSTNTIDTIHKVEGRQYPCPSIDTSLWRECLQKRRPVLHNEPADLSAESHRLVSGHPEVIRQLVVPVIRVFNFLFKIKMNSYSATRHQREKTP
jgi:PAS domain S-box-containing protein